jgi:hypothetical protein
MMLRPGKLLLFLLIPVALYGVAKGLMYFNAKRTVDDLIVQAANVADVRYDAIDTDLAGAVTLRGVSVQPRGSVDTLSIDAVRVASDDPLIFLLGGHWGPGSDAPPDSLSFAISGVRLPLQAELFSDLAGGATAAGDPCRSGLRLDPALLQRIGFSELTIDYDGSYRLDPVERTLAVDMHFDVHDVESIHFSATLTDVDPQALTQGTAPQLNLGGFEMSMRVSPEFGRQALKACAAGSEQSVQAWSTTLADRAIEELRLGGVLLGAGLQRAMRDFYREWGELKLVSRPAQPVGLLSLMFLPPDQLADALALNLSLNSVPITDTSFTLEKPDMPGLSALFGAQPEQAEGKKDAPPRRVIVRREYEPVAASGLGAYVDHQVRIQPRDQPLREGLLKGIRDGEAVVEQTLHGGKYTVYVPLAQIESAQALIQRKIGELD